MSERYPPTTQSERHEWMTVIECVQSHTMGICCERVRRLAWQVDALEARLAEATERIAELEAERNRLVNDLGSKVR